MCSGECSIPHSTWHDCFSGTTGCGGNGLARSKYSHEPHWACLRPNGGLDPIHPWSPFHCVWIAGYCPSGLGCSSPRKGQDPGGGHATSCACSSRHRRGSQKRYGDMDVSMFNGSVKIWSYAICFCCMMRLFKCAIYPLWSYINTFLCYFTNCRANSRLDHGIWLLYYNVHIVEGSTSVFHPQRHRKSQELYAHCALSCVLLQYAI